MNRWTARILLLLMLTGAFGPVALAISATSPHACCVRKPMRHSGHEDTFQALSHQDHRCCKWLATTHWTQAPVALPTHIALGVTPFNAGIQQAFPMRHAEKSLSARAPPQFSIS
jgi:hypothetical protein